MRRTNCEESNRAIGYVRVSTNQQAESKLGLEAQCKAIEDRAVSLKLTLGNIYQDPGLTGALPPDKRPGLMAALDTLQRGDCMIVAKRDRLSRDTFLIQLIEREVFERRGCRLVSAAGEGTDDDGPSSVLMRKMVDAFAEYERLMIGLRTAMALKAKRDRGERMGGGLEYGYEVVRTESRIQRDGTVRQMEIVAKCEVEQQWIAEMRRLYAEDYGTRRIARFLNDRKVPTRTGAAWSHQVVDGILRRNPLAPPRTLAPEESFAVIRPDPMMPPITALAAPPMDLVRPLRETAKLEDP